MAAEGNQILPPALSSAAAERDLPWQPSDAEDAREQYPAQALQDNSPGSESRVEDTEEPKGATDAEEREQKQDEEDEEKEENPDSYREAKRRKTSPAALKKPEERRSRTEQGGGDEGTGGGFSFSFDIRGLASPIETTPRFGSMMSNYNYSDSTDLVTPSEIGGGRADEETGKTVTEAILGSDA